MPYQPNRYNPPQAPLQSDYAPLSPPRHAVPGTKDVKSRAGNILLSVISTGLIIRLWQMTEPYHDLDPAWRWLVLPLLLGAAWPFLPMLQDGLITRHLGKHSDTYVYVHRIMAEEVTATTEEWSQRHNTTRNRDQRVTLTKGEREEALEASNQALAERLRTMQDQPTQRLASYTPAMRALVDLARTNDAGVVSERRAAVAGIPTRAFLEARNELVKAGILYQHGQVFRLQPEYILAEDPHTTIAERIAT